MDKPQLYDVEGPAMTRLLRWLWRVLADDTPAIFGGKIVRRGDE